MRKQIAILLLAWSALAGAQPTPEEIDARTHALAQQLRCLVCQNQTIADSQAELAVDLRERVREQVAQGSSDEQVIDWVVQRYGDFVLYRPPLRASTWLLWGAPLLLLVGGALALLRRLRRDAADAARGDAVTPEQQARAARLLAPDQDRGEPR